MTGLKAPAIVSQWMIDKCNRMMIHENSACPSILGVILAGGQSSRMGQEKAFVLLQGRPLIAHVVGRFQPQVGVLAINANGDPSRFNSSGVDIFPDETEERLGPFAGISSALAYAAKNGFTHVATVPVDAPFLPDDLVARLVSGTDGSSPAIALSTRGPEPLFALWPVVWMARVAAFLEAGGRAPIRFLKDVPHSEISFETQPDGPDPFLNLNTPQDILLANPA